LHDNEVKFDMRVAVVMPDRVHLIFTPLVDLQAMRVCSLAEIMDAIKGASAHKINKALGRNGRLWQPESFEEPGRKDRVPATESSAGRVSGKVDGLPVVVEEAVCESLCPRCGS
jgi:hypothetical protein